MDVLAAIKTGWEAVRGFTSWNRRRRADRPDLEIELEAAGTDRLNLRIINHGPQDARETEFLLVHLDHGVRERIDDGGRIRRGEEIQWPDLPQRLWPDVPGIGPGTHGVVICRDRGGRLHAWTTAGKYRCFGGERLSLDQILHRFYGESITTWTSPAPAARREIKRSRRR